MTRTVAVRPILLVATAALLTVAGLEPGAGAATVKNLTVNVTPHTIAVGARQTFTIALTNVSNRAVMGSADIRPPRPLSMSLLSATTPEGSVSIVNRTVQLRDTSVGPGETLDVTVVAQIPCVIGSGKWSVVAKTSSDLSGTGLFEITRDSSLQTVSSGDCTLVFLKQPGDAEIDQPITSADFDPEAGPVKVGILDGDGNTVIGSSADVTMTLGANPSGGTLSGTKMVTAVNGVANFSDLSIDTAGQGYRLRADAPSFTGVNSALFDIAGAGAVCQESHCAATDSDGTTSGTISSRGTGVVEISVTDGNLDCSNYTEVTGDIVFTSTTDSRKRVTVVIGPPLAHPKSEGFFQVCYSAPTPFLDRDGNLVTQGLLPSCRVASAPCVQRFIYGDQTVTVTFVAPAGDPKGRL